MRKSVLFSQNFLRDKTLVSRLVEKSSITKDDVVYEIGVGTGVITEELLKRSRKVVAFEIDRNLFNKLSTKFSGRPSLELKGVNFLDQSLPKNNYKVFSNIPFSITAAVVKKLTFSNNPPLDIYLIIQKEAAKKFAGKPIDSKNSQMAVLLYPWFEFETVYEFKKDDFMPRPKVDVVLLRIKKRENSLISFQSKKLYESFVIYIFNRTNSLKEFNFHSDSKPSEVDLGAWLKLFDHFLNQTSKQLQKSVFNFAQKIRKDEENIEKINRTRVDRDWKSFAKK